MRHFLPCAVLVLTVLSACGGLDVEQPKPKPTPAQKHGIDYLYDGTTIPEMHLLVSPAQWNSLLTAYDANNNTKQHIACDVTYIKGADTTVVTSAALRLRGNTSRRRPEGSTGEMHRSSSTNWHHCHYQVNFHKTVKDDDHKIHGAKKVTLKWFKDDPAYVRELYCYDLFRRAGVWTGAYSAYCRLFIRVAGDPKEAYLGVYNMIEPIDDDYLKVREEQFGSADGFLWKCRWGARLKYTSTDIGADLGTEEEHTYELKTHVDSLDIAKAQLQDFIGKLNSLKGQEFLEWTRRVMDTDLLLMTYAVNVAVGMWDDYWNNCNNYYLYFNSVDPTNYKVFFIPFDYDNTLGTSAQCGVQSDSGRQDPLNWGDSKNNPMIYKLLQISSYNETYKEDLLYLADGANGLLDRVASVIRVRAWQESIRPYVSNDTGEDMKISDRPASWSNHREYRLAEYGDNNFFAVKTNSIKQYCTK